jgi:hypothetical protein
VIRAFAAAVRLFVAVVFGAPLAAADEIRLPAPWLERTGPAQLAYHLDAPASGRGELAIEWTDVAGRLVDRRRQSFTIDASVEIPFSLDVRRAVARQYDLRVRLAFDERRPDGSLRHREGEARATFIARPESTKWNDYHIIMWQPQGSRAWGWVPFSSTVGN